MTPHTLSRKAAIWLAATLMMFYGAMSMASSLRLADPSELVGHWQLQQEARPGTACTLDLLQNAALGAGADCLSQWVGKPLSAGSRSPMASPSPGVKVRK